MSMGSNYRGWLLSSCDIASTYPNRNMRILCPACQTENASDATVCIHCASDLAVAAPAPVVQRLSLLEQAMAKAEPMPFAKPVAPPVAPLPAAPAVPEAAPAPAPAPPPTPAPAVVKPYTMPPLPPQPPARRRSRAPWILVVVLVLGLLGALAYEQLQLHGVSLSALRTARP